MGEYKLKKNPIARVDLDGNITEIKETSKKPVARVDLSGKITDVKQPKKKKKGNFVQRGLSTAGDALISAGEGFLRTTENWADYISYKAADVADYFGWVSDEYADEWRDAIKKDIIGDTFDNKAFNAVKDESYMNQTARSVFEGAGNVLAMIGGGEVLGVSSEASSLSNAVRTGVASFTNGYGSSMSEALRNGVDYKTAKKAAIINGTAEAISEQVFNGIPGMKVENWGGKLTGKIGSQVEKYFGTKAGKLALKALDASGEGLEEIISNVLVSTGNDIAHFFDKNYNYGMENQTGNVLKDAWSSATSKESWNSFLSASLTSALVGGGNTILSNVQKNNIIKAYAEDNNMSVKEVKDMFKQSAQETANYLQKQQPKMNLGERVETEQQARDITLKQMKDNTFVKSGTETDAYQYQETDNEKVNEMNKSLAEVANNTQLTRETAKTAERLVKDLGFNIKFTNNEQIQNQIKNGEIKAVDGANINGYVKNGTMYINVDSDQLANFTIGHETKHFFEANEELNNALNQSLKEYAQQKGVWDKMLEERTNLYTDKEGTLVGDPEGELLADLSGQFFTDYNFVSNLSTKNPSLFQKTKDFFQKLYYKATGQQEKLLLKQINENFNKVYREYSKTQPGKNVSSAETQFISDKETIKQEQQEKAKSKEKQEIKQKKENILSNAEKVEQKVEDSDIIYSLSKEYRGSHQIENAQSIINLDLNDIQNKVIEANGYLTKQDQNDLRKLKRILNNPNENVKIYRASPVNELNSGDWITTDKSYAQNIANNNGGKVYTYEVNANQLYYPDNVNELPSLHRLSSFQYIKNEDTKLSLSREGQNISEELNEFYSPKNKVTTRLSDLKRKEVELPTEQEKPLKLSKNEQKQVNNMNNEYLPLAVDKDVLKVEAADIANEINTTGDFDTTKKRSWIESLKSSDAIEDKSILNNLDFGKLNYQVQSNQKSLNKANDYIERNGYENSLNHVKDLIRSEKTPSAADVALMQRMTQEAIKNKDYQAAQELIMDTAILGTDLGQAVQALSIIQRLTPEGQLKLYTKIVNRAKIRGEKAFRDVQITPDMVETVLGAYNEDGTYDQNDLNSRVAQFKQNIAEQMKSTIGDKANAWRYLSMLGNPKTHIRNVISNVAMGWTTKVKNTMARTFETILPIKERTKTFVPASKEIRNFAKDTAIDMKGIITGENKYNEKVALEQEKRIFKSKVLEGVSRFNSAALEAEDWFFSRHAFEQNFREFLTARGIKTMEDVENNPDIVQQGKTYAVEQAEIATFRQYSKLASEISRIERNGKATKLALAAVLPFKKTPINVAKAGLKYSPLGLIKNVSYDAYQLSKGNINASQFIDNLSQGLTGTSIALVGYALAKAGILTGGSDDDKEDKYDSQLGKQNYAINIGGKSYSISWLSPTAMPLLVGANAYEKLEEEKDWSADILIDTLAKTLDPLSEMSFVSSLTDTLKSYNSGGIGMIKDMGETAAQSYVLQFFPTLFGQMASTLDDTKRSTKASNNTGFKFGEETVRKIMLKIPGLRNQLEPQTDIWGNEKEQSGNIITRAVESFIAPYSKTEDITSDIDKELKRVYNQTGETGVIPGIPQAYVKKDDETYRMSASEYTQYKKTFGQIANQTMNELFNSDSYQDVSDEDKSKMIENVYKYAREQAKQEYFNSINEDFETKKSDKIDRVMEEYDITAGDYYANMEEFNYADKNPDRYLAIKQIADYKDYAGYKEEINYIKNTYSDKNERKRAVYEYINGLPLSVEQKIILQKVGANYSIKQYRGRLQSYINNLDLTRDEKIAIDKVLFK